MSVSYTVHAGPVLVCSCHMKEKVESRVIKYNGCSNTSCKYNNPKNQLTKEAKFCPACGFSVQFLEKIKESKKFVKSVGTIYDLMIEGGFREDTFEDCWGGLNNEKLIENCDVLIPDGETSVKTDGFGIYLRNPDVKKEITDAETFLAKEIAFLRTKYDSVTVEWMVLTNGR